MSVRKVDLYECDGPCNPMISKADESQAEKAPEDWVTLIIPGERLHLCPTCISPESLANLYRIYTELGERS